MRRELNGFWLELDVNGNINIGLTKDKLTRLGELITCVPQTKEGRVMKAGDRLFSIETHRCLQTLFLPITGKLTYIQQDVEDDPTRLNEHTILATVREERI